ncbi:TPA: cation transporter [Clostridioides difficile]|uniref:cation diffusion facilitator family transporter n=1 Tax=Clostridioides difficile TaxID=1496 RepID=UPI0010AF41CA|nr:cation transporter [Clostridioides difficile]MCP8652255.1 cation transporter [Clostridioides difficile]MDM0190842.1 cation transporter [Clostridioides difficile]VIB55466.1 cation efflux family protein [Clostridioides difficile]HBE9527547.1 cation transporter [Clostridioides difficile]HBF0045305.1 cation transporter [Clostridioides difficile]
MIQLLARLWIKDYKNISLPTIQQSYAKLCSMLGIAINIALFSFKFIFGTISGSSAILADSFNNLADVATTILSFLGFIIAGIGAGSHHPFGHGRYEWLMSIFSSIAVIIMGFSLTQNSIQAIKSPKPVTFSYTITGWQIDGWCGLLVSIFIMISGFKSLAETIERILGQTADKDFIDKISELTAQYPAVYDVTNLIIHDYGLGHVVISMHLEGIKEEQRSILNTIAHDIKYALYTEMECITTIQIDILDTSEQTTTDISKIVNTSFQQMKIDAQLQDFRAVKTEAYTDITLTIAFLRRLQKREKEIRKVLEEAFLSANPNYRITVHFVIAAITQKNKFKGGE